MSNCLLLCLSLTLVYLFDIIIFESNGNLRIQNVQFFFVTLNIVTACVYCMYYILYNMLRPEH